MILAAIILALATSPPLTKQDRAAMQLTPEQIAASAEVTGTDALDPALWISTYNFLPKRGGDKWFRARIDKITGKVDYQFYMVIESYGRNVQAFRPRALTFETGGVLQQVTVSRIGFDTQCGRYGCTIIEDAVASISRADLDAAAQGAVVGQDITWAAKLFGDSQNGAEMLSFKTEIAGFLLAVDREAARINALKPAETGAK